MKTLNVVAAIIKKDNKILATKRGYGEFINMWEFPGGKIETNETKEEALIREIKEELDCTIKPTKFALNLEYQYPTFYLQSGFPKTNLTTLTGFQPTLRLWIILKRPWRISMDRLQMAKDKKAELEGKLEKVKGTPREEEFQMQLDKINQLIEHLENE